MTDRELVTAWEEFALELFAYATGEEWEDIGEEGAAAEGETALRLYRRLTALMAKQHPNTWPVPE